MRKVEIDIEDKLIRDELMEIKELFVTTINNPSIIRASDNFDIDFSKTYYPCFNYSPIIF